MANKVIDPGLRVDIMRKQMETKNELTHKGGMYIGTGAAKDYEGYEVSIVGTQLTYNADSPLYNQYPGGESVADAVAGNRIIFETEELLPRYGNTVLMARSDKDVKYDKITYNAFYPSTLSSINASAVVSAASVVDSHLGAYIISAVEVGTKQVTQYIDTLGIFTSIPNQYFYGCSLLSTVYFLNVVNIGNSAFYNCYSLSQINIPKIETIGYGAFGCCSQINQISLSLCQTISDYAFAHCSQLTQISLPVCQSIGSQAFYVCDSLLSADIGPCSSLGSQAFAYCSKLQNLNIGYTGGVIPYTSNLLYSVPRTVIITVPTSGLVNQYKSANG